MATTTTSTEASTNAPGIANQDASMENAGSNVTAHICHDAYIFSGPSTVPPPPYEAVPVLTPHSIGNTAVPVQSHPSAPTETLNVDIEAQSQAPSSTMSRVYTRLSDVHKRFKHSIAVVSAIVTLAIFTLELWGHIDELAKS